MSRTFDEPKSSAARKTKQAAAQLLAVARGKAAAATRTAEEIRREVEERGRSWQRAKS
jgi:hypothetical protein